MAAWGADALSAAVQAGVLAVWLVLVVRLLRPSPGWRAGLFLLGLLQFLAPALVTVALVRPMLALPGGASAGASTGLDGLALLAGAQLAGVAVGLVLLGRSVLALRRTLAGATRVEAGPLAATLREVAAEQGVQAPALWLTERAGPGAVGIRRPGVLVPRGLADTLEPGALRMVLAHEVAHVARRDPLAALVRRLVLAAWWFHPAAWLLARMHWAAAEDACDDVAAASDPAAYCDALLLAAGTPGLGGVAVGLGGHPLGRRFRRLLRAGPPGLGDRIAHRAGSAAAGGLLLAVAAVLVLAGPVRFVAFDPPGAAPDDVIVNQVMVQKRVVRTVIR